jgi:hypothetical protein
MRLPSSNLLSRYQAPDFSRLVPIDAAALILDVHQNSLARLCREKLGPLGQARQERPPEGGQVKWFIDKSYHPALKAADDPKSIPSDLSGYTEGQQSMALQRAACVDRFRNARCNGRGTMRRITIGVIDQARRDFPALRISRSRLYDWDKRYQHPADLWKLVDVRGGDRRHEASGDAWNAYRDLYLHQNQPFKRYCWKQVERLAVENGWRWCDYQSCRRNHHHHITKQEETQLRRPAIYRQQMAPYTEQAPESWRAGELYIGDHKKLDLICKWGNQKIRPWLSCWKDWRTRKVAGWVLSNEPNSTTILGALRRAILEPTNKGGPQKVWIDNGKDFSAWLFHGSSKKERRIAVDEGKCAGIFNLLGIEPHFALEYNPNGKARLERWFRDLQPFCQAFDTYTGIDTESKPERLADVLKNPRLIPSFEEVSKRLDDFIAAFNDNANHQMEDLSENGQTLSPNEAFARWCDTQRIPADRQSIDLLMTEWHRPVPVLKNGISLRFGTRTYKYGNTEPSLARFKALSKAERKLVRVSFDPRDFRTIRVYDMAYVFVCEATMNHVGGGGAISKEHLSQSQRNKARYNKGGKFTPEYSLTELLTPEEQAAAVARPPIPACQPTSMQIVQTPLDGQAARIQREEFRKAAGAEHEHFPSAMEVLRARQKSMRREPEPISPHELIRRRNSQ